METVFSCEKCHFSALMTENIIPGAASYECRFSPPSVHVISYPQQAINGLQLQVQVISSWPKVGGNAFCGYYKPRDVVFDNSLS